MKRLFLVLFAAVIAFGLCACGDSNTDSTSIEESSVKDMPNDDAVSDTSYVFESSSDAEASNVSEDVSVPENDASDNAAIEESDILEDASLDEESESDDSSSVPEISEPEVSEPDEETEKIIEYTVTVKSKGGIALPGLDVAVCKGSDLKHSAKTDDDGRAFFNLPESDDYSIVVSGAPKGYKVEKSYNFIGRTSLISLESSVVMGEDITKVTLGVGDIMYDFTVVDADGNVLKLSDVLKTKKFVVFNYWFTTCPWCIEEFYVMEELYGDYKDDIAIVAINPINDADEVKAFRDRYGLSFTMASCDYSWASVFDVRGYPTSVFIDRYGMICAVEVGAINTYDPWIRVFDYFTNDDYQQKIIYDLSEIY